MAPSAVAVAAAIRERAPQVGDLKLHKLLYYAQGHHLAFYGQPLFAESVNAWDMGPVVGRVWFAEKNRLAAAEQEELDESRLNTVGYVLSRYGGMTGNDLKRLSHDEPPWRQANEDRPLHGSVKISNESILEYFRSLADDDEAPDPPVDQDVLEEFLDGAGGRRAESATRDSLADVRARLDHLDA